MRGMILGLLLVCGQAFGQYVVPQEKPAQSLRGCMMGASLVVNGVDLGRIIAMTSGNGYLRVNGEDFYLITKIDCSGLLRDVVVSTSDMLPAPQATTIIITDHQ